MNYKVQYTYQFEYQPKQDDSITIECHSEKMVLRIAYIHLRRCFDPDRLEYLHIDQISYNVESKMNNDLGLQKKFIKDFSPSINRNTSNNTCLNYVW